jgi:hypothetical protein
MQAKKSREAWEPRRRMGQVPDKFAAWYIGIPAIVIGIPLIALVLLVPVSSHITGLTMGFWLLGALINIVWGLADLYFRKAFLAPINSNLQKVGYHLDLNTMKMAPGDAPKASAAGYYIGLIGLSLLLSWLLLVVNIIIKIAGKLSTLQEAEHVVAYRAALSMPNLLRADIVRIHLLFMEKNLQRKLSEKEMNELFVHSSLPDEEIIQVMRDLER